MPEEQKILNYQFINKTCRLVYLGNDPSPILGPHNFQEIARKKFQTQPKFLCSIRFGFYESFNKGSKIIVPFPFKLSVVNK